MMSIQKANKLMPIIAKRVKTEDPIPMRRVKEIIREVDDTLSQQAIGAIFMTSIVMGYLIETPRGEIVAVRTEADL